MAWGKKLKEEKMRKILVVLTFGVLCFGLGGAVGLVVAEHLPVSFLEKEESFNVFLENSPIDIDPDAVMLTIDDVRYKFVSKDVDHVADGFIGAQMVGIPVRLEFVSIYVRRPWSSWELVYRMPKKAMVGNRIVYQR